MATSFVPQALILEGNAIAEPYTNTGSTDITVGSIVMQGKLFGIATGPSSPDGGNQVIASGSTGSITYTPGLLVLASAKTGDTPTNGVVAFWDTTNSYLTTNATLSSATVRPIGIFAANKTAAAATAIFHLNAGVAAILNT